MRDIANHYSDQRLNRTACASYDFIHLKILCSYSVDFLIFGEFSNYDLNLDVTQYLKNHYLDQLLINTALY